MHCKVDYLSFTIDVDPDIVKLKSDERLIVESLIERVFPSEVITVVINNDWEIYKGGKHYSVRLMDRNSKFSLSYHPNKTYATVELSGQTCDIVRDAGLLDKILHLAKERVTRVDLAVDFETDCTPDDFLSNYNNVVFKGNSRIEEVTGITNYIGSWNSERFARIYRYHDPHPRSHLLRVEHVYKGGWAKSILPVILSGGIVQACLSCGEAFAWKHPLWDRGTARISKIKSPRVTPSQSSKYRWLVTQVAPAIRKARDEGWFDLDQFMRDHIHR